MEVLLRSVSPRRCLLFVGRSTKDAEDIQALV